MGKKARLKRENQADVNVQTDETPDFAQIRYKQILKIMSWIVGICFLIIITLPNFEFSLLDIIIKAVFYLGFFVLLLFAIFEFFEDLIKNLINKYLS